MSLSIKVQRLSELTGRIRALRVARQGLLAFALLFLGHLLSDPCGAYHRVLCAELDEAARPGRRLLGALPREHAKTTLGSVALVLRELCLGADAPGGGKRNVLLIAANREEGAAKLRQIVAELEGNALLQRLFAARIAPARDARGRSVAYGDQGVVLASGARVGVLGFGGRVRGQLSGGRRLDLIVLDDPEDDASCASPKQRRKLRRWFDHALLNALDVNRGSLLWLGSLLHHDSVLAQELQQHGIGSRCEVLGSRKTTAIGDVVPCPEQLAPRAESQAARPERLEPSTSNLEPPSWRTLRLPAIGDNGAPLWPERWSLDKLVARRAEIGERAFAQEYQNQPVSLEQQVFRPERFRTFDPARLRRQGGEWVIEGLPLRVVIGVDPAIGEQARHDWFVALVLGLGRPAEPAGAPPLVYVLDVLRLKAPFAEQLKQLGALARAWLPQRIGIEAVAYQAALAQAAWDAGLPVLALAAQSRKWARIEAAALHQAEGRLFLPVSGAWVAAFRQEAAEYPVGSHDDQLDALARALEAGLPLAGGAWEVLSAGARRSEVDGF